MHQRLQRVVVRAPVRVDFAGGPSDVAPFCVQEWGYVVNAAIDKYAYAEVQVRADPQIVVTSHDLQQQEVYPSVDALGHDSPLRLLTTAIALVGSGPGLDVGVKTEVPAGAGLGASAAVCVALLRALQTLQGAAEMRVETGPLHNVGGGQDQYAAAFGGVQSFQFAPGGTVRKPLPIATATQRRLEDSLVLCYSGTSRISGTVLAGVMDRYVRGDPATTRQLRRLREIALEIEALLESGDLDGFGEFMTAAWQAFRALHPSVSTPAIEQILAIGRAHGATGGKALGAGGGGCVLLACDPAQRSAVAAALEQARFATIPFHFAAQGAEVIAIE